MKLTWLGQAGWLICTAGETRIMIDPYLSDSLRESKGENYRRQVELCPELLSVQVDVLVITHSHADHLDWGTLRPLLAAQQEPRYVLGPRSVWEELRKESLCPHELVLFREGSEYTAGDVRLIAVPAAHSDPQAIGVVLETEGKRVYHTGDTLYHRDLFSSETAGADALLLPINGRGNNMNAADAAHLVCTLRPRLVVPMHYDMFVGTGCCPESFAAMLEGTETNVCILPSYGELEL